MNKNLILTSIVIFFTTVVSAQAPSIQWQKSLGGTNSDQANNVQVTSDGGYIVAGFSKSIDGNVTGNHGDYDSWIVKLNGGGTMTWQKALGGSGLDWAVDIQNTSDGGYIVAGYSYSNDGDVTGNHGDADYWIVKLNSSGTIQWQKSLGGSGLDQASAILQTSDDGYIVTGSSRSTDGDISGNHGGGDSWIVKLNNNGVIQWEKVLGGSGYDWTNSIEPTADGGYVLVGFSNSSNGDFAGNHGGNDAWIIKLNSSGIIQWQKLLGGNNNDQANSIQQSSDGGYIVAGSSASNNGDVTGNHGSNDYWILKLNSSGAIQWQKSMGGSGDDSAASIQMTADGGYIIAGRSGSVDGDVTENHGLDDYWIVKLDSNGVIQWQKSFGGSDNDRANSIKQTSDFGYIFTGYSNSTNGNVAGNHGSHDYWVVKLNPENLSNQETVSKDKVLVENPVKDQIKIQSQEKITSLQLYNVTGQLIKTSNSQNMSVKELSKGVYILKIQLENGKVISEKVIKE